jgi:DNA-binding FadR family transcriptional regulator
MDAIKKINISQLIVEKIIELVSKGELTAGDKIPSESELMERFQVGRSSVREAMQALSIMNLVDIRPGQGTFIRDFSSETMFTQHIFAPLVDKEVTMDLAEARNAIEPVMAALAAKRATEEDLNDIEALINRCREEMKKKEPVYELSAEFHLLVAKASHNKIFFRFVQSVEGLLAARGARIEEKESFTQWEMESHNEIYQAIKSRDPEAADRIMRKHIETSANQYLELDD